MSYAKRKWSCSNTLDVRQYNACALAFRRTSGSSWSTNWAQFAKLVNRYILLWTATACCWCVHSIGLPCFPNTACLLLAKLLLVCGHPYVRSTFPSSFMPQFSSVTETSEICAVEIALGDGNRKDRHKILGIYRPPAASLPAFSDQIEHIITNFLNESVLLVGDFNIDLLCETLNENFFNLLYSYNFSPLINVATRETNANIFPTTIQFLL